MSRAPTSSSQTHTLSGAIPLFRNSIIHPVMPPMAAVDVTIVCECPLSSFSFPLLSVLLMLTRFSGGRGDLADISNRFDIWSERRRWIGRTRDLVMWNVPQAFSMFPCLSPYVFGGAKSFDFFFSSFRKMVRRNNGRSRLPTRSRYRLSWVRITER
jgi:hypothetical protein